MQSLLENRIVVELGCGNGACGIFAGRFCKRTILTDGDHEALQLAKLSVRSAQSQGWFYNLPEVVELSWGDMKQIDSVKQNIRQSKNNCSSSVVVIGADLVYYQQGITPLIETIVNILDLDQFAVCVLSFAPRFDGWQEEILESIQKKNLYGYIIDAKSIVSELEYDTGWYNNVRVLYLGNNCQELQKWKGQAQLLNQYGIYTKEQCIFEAIDLF